MKEIIVATFVFFGSFFTFTACLGMFRFDDIFTRLHASSNSLIFGISTILFGLMIHFSNWEVSIKSLILIVFLLMTAPLSAHLVGKASNYSK
ncbi:MAG: monovalent cation/H(+) antiporter subunit G [Bacteriovoracaceae bacterium]